jgi:hypothetical protein
LVTPLTRRKISLLISSCATLPLTRSLSPKRLCRNWGKSQNVLKRNRQADEKALERNPLKGKLQKPQYYENIEFQALWTLTHSNQEHPAF